MSGSVTQTAGAIPKAPMAQGPIPKPEMRGMCIKFVRRWSFPAIAITAASYVAGYFLMYEKHRKQYDTYIKNLDPDKMFEEIKEYGGFKSVKASWQE
ncbi:cytochrome c oxidase subunit 6C-like [Styela clava]